MEQPTSPSTAPHEVSPPRSAPRSAAASWTRERTHSPVADPDHRRRRSGSPPDSVPFLVAHHPPEVSPRQQPYRVTAALAFAPSASPAPSPRCRDDDPGDTPTSRPCSTAESVARIGVATSPRSILPWACVPDRTRSRSEPAAGWATRASPKAPPTAGPCTWRGIPTRPHGDGTDRPPDDARAPELQVRTRPASKRGSASWTGRFPLARPRPGRSPARFWAFLEDQGGCFHCLYGRATRLQLRSGRSHDLPCAGFTAGPRGAPNRSPGAPPPLHRRSDTAAEAARVARSSARRASPRRHLRQRDRRDDQGHAPCRQW